MCVRVRVRVRVFVCVCVPAGGGCRVAGTCDLILEEQMAACCWKAFGVCGGCGLCVGVCGGVGSLLSKSAK